MGRRVKYGYGFDERIGAEEVDLAIVLFWCAIGERSCWNVRTRREVFQGSSVPSFSNKQIKKGFTTTTHCDDNDISFLISRFRKNPVFTCGADVKFSDDFLSLSGCTQFQIHRLFDSQTLPNPTHPQIHSHL